MFNIKKLQSWVAYTFGVQYYWTPLIIITIVTGITTLVWLIMLMDISWNLK